MSRKYKSSREVPLTDICARLDQLSDAVTDREKMKREFTMRVPAECDRDADLVISEAAARLRAMQSEIETLQPALKEGCE